jgi:hypothetical protein
MSAEHGPEPGLTDYLIATGSWLGARREGPGVILTPPEQQVRTRNMSIKEIAAEIRMMRGTESPSIGRVIAEELADLLKRQIYRERGHE